MKQSRRKKWTLFFTILVVFVLTLVLITPRLFDINRYNAQIVSAIQEAVGGNVRLGPVAWGFTGVLGVNALYLEVNGFSIENASAFPGDIKLAKAYAEISILPLISKTAEIRTLVLTSPSGTIRLETDKHHETEQTVTKSGTQVSGEDRSAWPVEVRVVDAVFENGRITIEDSLTIPGQKIDRTFSDLAVHLSNLTPAESARIELSFRDSSQTGLGSFTASGTLSGLTDSFGFENPNLTFQASLSEVNADAVKSHMQDSALAGSIGGTVSLTINYKGNLGKQFEVDGILDVSQLTYTNAAMYDEPVKAAGASLTYRIKSTDDRLAIDQLKLSSGNLTIDAQADVFDWTTHPVLKNAFLTANLPLQEIQPYVPWQRLGKTAAIVQDLLKAGGQISIDRTVLPDIELQDLPEDAHKFLSGVKLNARIADISAKLTPQLPEIRISKGNVQLENSVITIKDLTAQAGPAQLTAKNATVTEILSGQTVNVLLNGPLEISQTTMEPSAKLLAEWGLKQLSGTAALDLDVRWPVADPTAFTLNGNVGLRKFNVATTFNPASVQDLDADVRISPDRVDITTLSAAVNLPASKDSPGGRFKLNFKGRIKNWRKNPSLTIQRLDTSAIAMRSLKPSVPWDKLDPEIRKIAASLVKDGSIRIKGIVVPNIALTHPPAQPLALLEKARAAVELQGVSVSPFSEWQAIEGITGLVSIENNTLKADDLKGRSGPLVFPDLDLRVTSLSDKPKVSVSVEGSVNLGRQDMPEIDAILKDYGLKNINGNLDMRLQAQYDHARPEKWQANGLLKLSGIQAVSDPAGVKMEDLNGQVTLRRKNTLEISVKKVTGKIENALIRLNGRFVSGGRQKYFLDAAALAKELDLAHVVALFPGLKETELAGILDMDLSVRYAALNPAATQLKGKLKTRALGLRLVKNDVSLKNGQMDATFTGNGIRVNNLAIALNDQPLSIEGQLMDPKQPDLQLTLRSENLNFDRILAPFKKKEPQTQNPAELEPKTKSAKKEEPAKSKPSEKKNLPQFAANLSAQVMVEIAEGSYRGQHFQDLKIETDYKNGVLNHYDIDVEFGGGSIQNKGRADLRELEKIVFQTNPTIIDVRTESIGRLIDDFEPSLRAPVCINGNLKGRTGSKPELIESLSGNLAIEVGQGHFTNIGPAGKGLLKILSIVNIQGLVSGRLVRDMANEGITIRYINASAAFKNGEMQLGESRINSDALNINGRGTVDLLNQQVDLDVDLEPLGTVTGVLRQVPLLGRKAASFTKIYTDVQGPLDDPDVFIRPARTFTRGVEQKARSIGNRFGGGAN